MTDDAERIIKALRICDGYNRGANIVLDAAAQIERDQTEIERFGKVVDMLKAQLERVTSERDAAIKDIEPLMSMMSFEHHQTCKYCGGRGEHCDLKSSGCNAKWRGLCAENGGDHDAL